MMLDGGSERGQLGGAVGGHDGPPWRWSDRAIVLPPTWQPAPWIGDGPVTAAERLWAALDARAPGWRRIGWDWAALVILVALLTRLAEGAR